MTKQQIRESLNKLDHRALDECTKYYDLVNLYESVKMNISAESYRQLESLVKKGNAEKISNFLLKPINEAFSYKEVGKKDNSDLNLNNIFKEELLQEDKIVPEKCYAKESGKPYYSLKNITDDEYVQYGARTRYNSKAGAAEKLRDLKAHVDGEYIDDSNVIKSDSKADESLNEANEPENVKAIDTKPLNPLKQVSTTLADSVMQMVQKPINVSGAHKNEPKIYIWILIKLYQKSNGGDPNIAVSREDLLLATGTPPERARIDTQQQTLFLQMSGGLQGKPGDNLVRLSGKNILPTANLKPFIEGQNQFGIDFRKYIGGSKDPEILNQPRDAQESDNQLKSREGWTYNKYGNAEDAPAPDPNLAPNANNAEITDFDWSMFESFKLNTPYKSIIKETVIVDPIATKFISQKGPTTLDEIRKNRKDKMRADWKAFQDLDEDAEIDYKKSFNDEDFKHFCSMHGYSYAKDKDLFLSED